MQRYFFQPISMIVWKGNKKIQNGQIFENHTFLMKMRRAEAKKALFESKTIIKIEVWFTGKRIRLVVT